MIALAQSEPGIPVSPSDFDQHPDLLNCLNGTVSLRSGRIKLHDPADLLTQLIPISFDEDAPRERWKQFLKEVFKDRQELIDYLQRLIGFYITGLTTEQIFAIFHGSGANGKSTLLDVLLEVFADYMTTTPFSTFAAQRYQGIGTTSRTFTMSGSWQPRNHRRTTVKRGID
jgi:putative DNA primase/helicase